jgi:hypothetical protein
MNTFPPIVEAMFGDALREHTLQDKRNSQRDLDNGSKPARRYPYRKRASLSWQSDGFRYHHGDTDAFECVRNAEE